MIGPTKENNFLWEAEMDGSPEVEFETNLTNMVKPCLYKKYKN